MTMTPTKPTPSECEHYYEEIAACELCGYHMPKCANGNCPDYNPKRRKMANDCKNLYKGELCWLTAHDHARCLFAYPCAYPHNCKECKDYKPKEKK